MKFGSLFAGIGGFDLGLERAGMECAWQVEIDTQCQRILRRHYPGTAKHLDVRDCGAHNLEKVDVITFGSPCQDFSIAGKRAGIDGERSGLFHEAIRIIGELNPTFAVWENVPGAYSSNAGRDFAAILGAFRECGARDIAWRTLDSQYFGVPQRRRRIFLVADFRSECAGEILFESEGVPGDIKARGKAGADTAGTLAAGAHPSGFNGQDAHQNKLVVIKGAAIGRKPEADPQRGEVREDGLSYTLNTTKVHAVCNALSANGVGTCGADDNQAQARHLVFDWQSGGDVRLNISSEKTSALQASQTKAVHTTGYQGDRIFYNTWGTLSAKSGNNGGGSNGLLHACSGVRRLMPVECERLQGFPDGWTAWGIDGNGERVDISDAQRYRMLGNAVTVNVAQWIGKRIVEYEQ
jgi:DNA (cytosine-5)-methyltransferase 1